MSNIGPLQAFKQKLKTGQRLAGTMLEELKGGPFVKVFEQCGYDFYFIDCEHGTYSYESVADMVLATNFDKLIPLVRVAEIRKEAILKVLDTGAGGIMVPAIRSAEEAAEAVRLSKFKPQGYRGYSTFKYFSSYSTSHPADILRQANEGLIVIMQIETREAVEHIRDIAAVEGVDALLVGPGDLSLSLGHPGEPGHPEVVQSIGKVMHAAREHGLGAGIHCGRLEDLLYWKSRGMNMLMWSSPLYMVYNASAAALSSLRDDNSK